MIFTNQIYKILNDKYLISIITIGSITSKHNWMDYFALYIKLNNLETRSTRSIFLLRCINIFKKNHTINQSAQNKAEVRRWKKKLYARLNAIKKNQLNVLGNMVLKWTPHPLCRLIQNLRSQKQSTIFMSL